MKKTYLLISFFSLLVICCRQNKEKIENQILTDSLTTNQNPAEHNNMMEDKIRDAIFKLPEVIESNRYIDSFSNHKHGISVRIDKSPENEPVYYVDAGYNGELRWEKYYSFSVDTNSFQVKIYDITIDENYIPLDEWRKMNKK